MPDHEEQSLPTETYVYTLNSESETIKVHTDPAGLWHAGVAATVWDSSLILAKHFEKMIANSKSEQIDDTSHELTTLLSKPTLKVLELGAGCSAIPTLVLAMYAYRHNASGSSTDMDLADNAERGRPFTVTDKIAALPLLRKTIVGQKIELSSMIDVNELDWQADNHSSVGDQFSQWDLIIASDLLAFPELYGSLVATLSHLSSSSTVIYIAYERRNFAAEIEFFRFLGEVFTFEMIPEKELDDVWRAPGEIYLYRARCRPHRTLA